LVPILTAESLKAGTLPNHSLVKYIGMVQDIFDLEFFCGVYEEVNCSTG
ncbi:unnamed protein product, partial [Heterosigma akashiwo]